LFVDGVSCCLSEFLMAVGAEHNVYIVV
jgi:hypothetical protein